MTLDLARALTQQTKAIERLERSIATSFQQQSQGYDLAQVSSRIQAFPFSVVVPLPPTQIQLIGNDPRRWFIALYTTDTLGANIGFSNNPPFNGIFIDQRQPFIMKYPDWGPLVGSELWATAVAAPLTIEIYSLVLLQKR